MNCHRLSAFETFTHNLIHRKARQLVRKEGFNRDEREDIEQELHLHLLRGFRKYDPSRSPPQVFARR